MTPTSSTGNAAEFGGLYLVGGDPALDFVNSVKYRGRTEDGDRLDTLDAAIQWAHVAGIVDPTERDRLMALTGSDTADRIHRDILKLREAARVVIDPASVPGADFDAACASVEAALAALCPVPVIDRNSGTLSYGYPITGLLDFQARIVACIGALLQRRAGQVIKSCDGEDCDWVFIDTTKAKRRRWCDTRTCGNIDRVRRHRKQRKAT